MNATTTQWIFTFGFGRQRMVDRFGLKWSMQYPSKEAAGVERYGLREISLY